MIPAVIPFYKEWAKLRKCKKHLLRQTMPVVIHVVNDSRLHSGYTAAVNRGLRHWLTQSSEWNYVVVLDQDMYLDQDAVEEMFKFMESHPKCGIAVSLQRLNGRPFFAQGGGIDCFPAGTVKEGHVTYFDVDEPIFWGDVACMMVRKECIWDIGLLDENFTFICSDSDYTLTARTKGWEVWIPCKVRGIHEKGQAHPNTYKDMSKEEIMKRPLVQQMHRDLTFFEKKWVSSGYYDILKYEDDKPIFIIKSGKVVPADGQGPEIDKLKNEWLKRKEPNVVSA